MAKIKVRTIRNIARILDKQIFEVRDLILRRGWRKKVPYRKASKVLGAIYKYKKEKIPLILTKEFVDEIWGLEEW